MKISSDTTLEHTRNINVPKNTSTTTNQNNTSHPNISEMTDAQGKPTKQAYQTAVNKMNEFMEHNNKNSKFIFHEGLGKYYVEVVDSKTDEVVKEIPPKELLDAYYEMQKMIGNIVDHTI